MKKTPSKTEKKLAQMDDDEIRTEYDFSSGVRGKYAKTLRDNGYTIRIRHTDSSFTEKHVLGKMTVLLEPDVWEYFSDSESVNQALRTLISLVAGKPKKTITGD